jgi:hypothetical protein
MSTPSSFSSETSILHLPLLIPGQAQKEFFVNKALVILDSLQPQALVASQSAPPADATEGGCYRVTEPAVQEWEGCEDHIAVWIGGDWHFIAPHEGMKMFDRGAGQSLIFRKSWHAAAPVTVPTGGTVVDLDARAAIGQLLDALRVTGILPSPTT